MVCTNGHPLTLTELEAKLEEWRKLGATDTDLVSFGLPAFGFPGGLMLDSRSAEDIAMIEIGSS